MTTNRCIILAGLDDQSRSVIESCLPNDQFEVTQVDPESGNETHERVVWSSSRPRMMFIWYGQLCASMRNRFGDVPLLACAGRYVFPTIRPLLETDLQGLIVTPFDASEFRAKMDQMELGF